MPYIAKTCKRLIEKRWIVVLLLFGISALFGCGQEMTEIRNANDGKLRIDGEREIDFYLGNDEVGADPITEQCLAIIGDRKPDSVETNLIAVDFNGPEDYFEIYNINGVEIAAFLKEREAAVINVSMRAKTYGNVAEIAGKFGGGGHIKAAGCTFYTGLESARTQLKAAIEESLRD